MREVVTSVDTLPLTSDLLIWFLSPEYPLHRIDNIAVASFVHVVKYKVKVKVTLEQATKDQRGSRVIALHFLYPLR